MQFDYSPNLIRAGQKQRRELEAPLGQIMTNNDSSTSEATGGMDQPFRPAGAVGARALAMMQSPEEQRRTQMWNQQFARSPQGMQFFGVPTIG